MTLTTIYIARHGYRSNWLPPPHPPNPTGVDLDPPLAPHGVDQAHELAQYLLLISPKPSMILTLPFYRCVETAVPTAELLGTPIALERGIGEWYKPDRPVIPQPVGYGQLKPFFEPLTDEWSGSGVIPLPTGEDEHAIFARCQAFAAAFVPAFELAYPKVECVMLVTHAATAIALGMALLGHTSVREPLEDGLHLRAGTCSLTQIERSAAGWRLAVNGNTEFLSQGEEMHWDFANGFEAGSAEDIALRAAASATFPAAAHPDAAVASTEAPQEV